MRRNEKTHLTEDEQRDPSFPEKMNGRSGMGLRMGVGHIKN